MKGSTLTVVDSDLGQIPAGTTLEVEKDRTNQFTDRRVLTVRPTTNLEGRIEGSTIQIFQMPDNTKDVWKEIVVGRDSDTILISKS
jgi:hypothetical protein